MLTSLLVFVYKGYEQKFGNWKYPLLSFDQYLKTGASYEYQIWHECLNKKLLSLIALKITAGQRSLTVVTGFATAEKLR